MKKSILTLGLFFVFTLSQAQIRVAIVGGAHQSEVLEENNLPTWNTEKTLYSPRLGFHGGFIADIPLGSKQKLFFQPGVVYHNKGREYYKKFDTTITRILSITRGEFINYVDIPFNLVYKAKIGKKAKFIIGAGPYVNVFYNGKLKWKADTIKTTILGPSVISYSNDNNDPAVGNGPGKYKVLSFGVNGLAGFEIGRFFITGNYSRGLDNFFQPADYDASSYKHQVIGGTIGIFLGKPIIVEKKPADKDKDGISDDKDKCPNEPGTAITNGCPDKDNDGIADKEDNCPDKPGLLKYNGCPIPDTDGDGINDDEDKCPAQAGLAKYNGCLVPDSDGDGVNDELDKCPTKAGTTKYNGCPVPDTDGDGINDEEDNCPTTKGIATNNGCPEIKKEVVERINYAAKRIQFQEAKANLLPQSLKILNEVAQILIDNPDLNLLIEGHTSNQGNIDVNMKLSEERAQTVLQYLTSKGIEERRLTAEGFGPTKPIADEKTPSGRAQNRRVELKPYY